MFFGVGSVFITITHTDTVAQCHSINYQVTKAQLEERVGICVYICIHVGLYILEDPALSQLSRTPSPVSLSLSLFTCVHFNIVCIYVHVLNIL